MSVCSSCGAAFFSPQCPHCTPAHRNASATAVVTDPAACPEPAWRQEIARKVVEYRQRRRGAAAAPLQRQLPFPPLASLPTSAGVSSATPARPSPVRRRLTLEIAPRQSAFSFPAPESTQARVPASSVAPLRWRTLAGLADTTVIVVCWLSFFVVLAAAGVRPLFRKIDLAVCLATLFLFYLEYFTLFTLLVGTTPGMRLARLQVRSFDGSPPRLEQFLWRSLGYVVSGLGGLLGFLWALCDADRLCWHDRISQTYLTRTNAATIAASAEDSRRSSVPAGMR